MKTTLTTPVTLIQSVKLWLFTNAAGTLLLGALMGLIDSRSDGASGYILLIGVGVAGLSSPLIALAAPVLNRILGVKGRAPRLLLLFTALTTLWALPTTLMATVIFGNNSIYHEILPQLTLPYYVGALLSGSFVYRHWLFPSNE